MPLRFLLTPTILIPIANYTMVSSLDISLRALLPLFFSTPTSLGGLGLNPASIGLWLALYGIVDVAIQVLFFSRAVDLLGPKRLFTTSVWCYAPVMLLFPIMSWLVHVRGTVDYTITIALLVQLTLVAIWDMAFGAYHNGNLPVIKINPINYRDCLRVYHRLRPCEESPRRYQWTWSNLQCNGSCLWASLSDFALRIFKGIQCSRWKCGICRLDCAELCTELAWIALTRR